MAFCANCGKQLPEGAQFCGECGHPVASQPDAQAELPVDNSYDEVVGDDYLSWGKRILSFFIAPAGVFFIIFNFVKRRTHAGKTALGWTIAGQVVFIVLYIIFVIVLATSARHHSYYYY